MKQIPQNATKSKNFTILSMNIANPSLDRANRQIEWLNEHGADAYVLTECKGSSGCSLLENHFLSNGYDVIFPILKGNEYGVLVASKHELTPTSFSNHVKYLNSRVVSVSISSFGVDFDIIGVYVPSRGTCDIRKGRKKRFIQSLYSAIRKIGPLRRTVFCGDFNVVEPNHLPHYSVFEEWEYSCYNDMLKFQFIDAFRHLYPNSNGHSWIGRVGNGYRYDYCFISEDMLNDVQNCYYVHEPREKKLTDHAAIVTELKIKHRRKNR